MNLDPLLKAHNINRQSTNELVAMGLEIIKQRKVPVPLGWPNNPVVLDCNLERSAFMLHDEYSYQYGRRSCTFHIVANYIFIYDSNSLFADRVHGDIKTVNDALEWLKPPLVKEAIQRGMECKRQGDMFLWEATT